MLQNNPTLKAHIDKLWNKFWSGGIANPLTAITQITYLLFMRRIDDLDKKKIADAEFTGEPYQSKFEGEFYLASDTEKRTLFLRKL
jgi:type I restriction enzyme M protein